MIDIDYFKSINDQHGHDGGDLVLKALAKASSDALRSIDLVARIGGEEFAGLLPETTLERATEVAERLRHSLASLSVALPAGRSVSFTVSVGVAMCDTADGGIDAGVKRADMALYRAKERGRNRVEVARPETDRAAPV